MTPTTDHHDDYILLLVTEHACGRPVRIPGHEWLRRAAAQAPITSQHVQHLGGRAANGEDGDEEDESHQRSAHGLPSARRCHVSCLFIQFRLYSFIHVTLKETAILNSAA